MAYGPANAAKSQRRLVDSVIDGWVGYRFCWLDSALTVVDDGHRHGHAGRRVGK